MPKPDAGSPACEVRVSGPVRRWPLLNIWVDDLSRSELLDLLATRGGLVFTLNPDHLWHLQHDPAFLAAYRQADWVTMDSAPLRGLMGWTGRPLRERITGSDLVPAMLHHAVRQQVPWRFFLLGAAPGVAETARRRMNERAGQALVVGALGPSMRFVDDPQETETALAAIRASGANVLLVGLGAPKQEVWLARHRHALPGVKVLLGVGATLDYEAGAVRRAPVWMRRMGLEWAYRIGSEPGRYLRRYGRNTRFLWWMLQERLGRYRDPFGPDVNGPV
ncbi:WecB/TagA/CpsF family glycosyltransferase [Ideonella livida]|uniref:WecB/TagA/CpsF family glycosyltransferase n=1 Tax=Ideonella livida TaxID=2707176 RepID=A0A7C9PFW9_9BURK|nr:WecB/TagA/CpsF family glycosyltransferase [Ideonella livida]NDY90917.1 WecB/TagA/CpsF family glycosyltransferase [Ideonella livida]